MMLCECGSNWTNRKKILVRGKNGSANRAPHTAPKKGADQREGEQTITHTQPDQTRPEASVRGNQFFIRPSKDFVLEF